MSRHLSTMVESQRLGFQGLEIAMRVSGEGPPLLLVNGMTRSLQSWGPFARELTGRTIVTFDAPGVGASPNALLPLSIPGHAALASAVLDAAGLAEADVLGFSHGGAVAQQLALDVPDRVRRLVLVATSCGVGATPSRGRAILRSLRPPADYDPWQLADAVGLFWHSLAISSWSSISFLGAIRSPTLVVCGTRDSVVPPANSWLLARRIPGASLVMLPGGHDLQRAKSAGALARAVDDFLNLDQLALGPSYLNESSDDEGQHHG